MITTEDIFTNKITTYFILYRATTMQMTIIERGKTATVRIMTGAAA